MMRQCKLRKDIGEHGFNETVAWLPEKFAVDGNVVDVKLYPHAVQPWDEGWIVTRVYASRLEDDYVREHARDYTHQREASDV